MTAVTGASKEAESSYRHEVAVVVELVHAYTKSHAALCKWLLLLPYRAHHQLPAGQAHHQLPAVSPMPSPLTKMTRHAVLLHDRLNGLKVNLRARSEQACIALAERPAIFTPPSGALPKELKNPVHFNLFFGTITQIPGYRY